MMDEAHEKTIFVVQTNRTIALRNVHLELVE